MSSFIRKGTWKDILGLAKIRVILPVAFTAFTGYFLACQRFDIKSFGLSIGVMLLAAAASALNQIQEKDIDFRMSRTRKRPIPSGNVTVKTAQIFSITCFLAGSLLLYFNGALPALLLGLFSLIWYNLIYTPLKRKTAFAIIPGSLTGAIPPLIGWVSAGGGLFDKTAVLLAFLMFMAQVPHFWLLLLIYGKEYEKAGMPSLTKIFTIEQISRLSFIWISGTLVSALILAFLGMLYSPVLKYIVSGLTMIALIYFTGILKAGSEAKARKNFIVLNAYIMTVLLILLIDKF
ncbi:MAG: protoheme IX farnesyltransferase [Bacteroidales bacterium]|nr:protoheme IX farnesyltransferase [Bacteroidales bacterium]MCF8405978.1 protoheme IX farnesyltransferase [Bacteroidales bacterium]